MTATCAIGAELPAVTPVGDGSFRVTATSRNVFSRSGNKQTALAEQAAKEFCDRQGKHLKIISTKTEKPFFPPDFVSTTLIFRALEANDPELASTSTNGTSMGMTMGTPTDRLYAELTKLDELRKKGLLTDEEFAAEKQKVLARSK